MYRYLSRFLILALLCYFSACEVVDENDRYIPVDLEVSNRATLIVEFSGLQCMNCPNAASEAHMLQDMYPGKCIVVEMHPASNPLTEARKPEWNYTNEASDIYYKHFGGTSTTPFPMGVINLTKIGNDFFLPFRQWAAAYQSSASKPSHIDLQQMVTLDTITSTLTINTYITNLSMSDMTISYIAWLTEDSIIGPQMMPDGNVNHEYAHNHVLRDTITDVWGTAITIATHETERRTITYPLPNNVKAHNCNVVGIVMNDDEVIQVNEYKLNNNL